MAAWLPVEQAAAIDTVLTATARTWAQAPGQIRTLAQLRADALAAPFLHALASGTRAGPDPTPLARHHGRLPGIHLHLHTPTVDGSDDHPAQIEGLGPIPGRLGRALADHATTRRHAQHDRTDDPEPGHRPSAALAAHVEARDRTCRYPGCTHPARTSDLDHTQPWPHGTTSADNLVRR